MMNGFKTRVARLEGRDEQGRPRGRVVWLRPDGLPENPEDLEGKGQLICLPRKSVSLEAWVRECALRGQSWPPREDPEPPAAA
jgi:hypothetical protein